MKRCNFFQCINLYSSIQFSAVTVCDILFLRLYQLYRCLSHWSFLHSIQAYNYIRLQTVDLCEQVIEMCGNEPFRLEMKEVHQSLEDASCGVLKDVTAIEVRGR